MSVQISYKKQFLVYFLLLVIFLTAIEIGIRAYEWTYPNCSFVGNDAMKDIDFFKQRQICLENQQIRTLNLETNPENIPNQDFGTISINSLGFRGEEFDVNKDESVFRIFMLGGSTVFGTGASSNSQTIPAQLEKKLDLLFLDQRIEVINGGISGANSKSEKMFVQETIFDYSPDLIIIYDGWNDAWLRDRLIEIEDNEVNQEKLQNSGTGIIQALQENLNFYRTPLVIYKEFFWDKSWRYDSMENNISVDNKISQIWKSNQRDICLMAKENKIQSVLILQPILGTGNKQLSPNEIELFPKSDFDLITLETLNSFADHLETLSNTCSGAYDYRGIFDETSKSVFFDKGHISDFGNDIISEQIARDIQEFID
ncbi:SGNH/GDSL hydrolase family protein [Candidatus Nitrosopelagicus sp.]|nr:SGNH/GDSL hydrolase family protein [Candidatus Nitrosopelagicus sp.]